MPNNSQYTKNSLTKNPSKKPQLTQKSKTTQNSDSPQAFAEIIESSLQDWKAQCWQWDKFPSFGSIVTIQSNNKIIYGIVHQVQMGSMDSSRYPFAYQKTEDELLREQPQIFEFLKTTFSCITIGYKHKSKIYYLLSPTPPKIHSFVRYASQSEARQFFASTNYLHLLFGLSGQIFNLEELLLAMINYQVTLNIFSPETIQEKINNFIETFSLLAGNDYRRLKLFLQRVEPLLKTNTNRDIHV